MIHIQNFDSRLVMTLPETFELLRSADLVVHDSVSRITLHGSRGLARNARPASDIDLSLLVGEVPLEATQPELEAHLQAVYDVTRSLWHSPTEADLAIIFDLRACGLACFEQTAWHEGLCRLGGLDCFGLFKMQRGFHGLVTDAGIQVRRMYPCLTIWQRA
jgi:hypothetical protein